MMKDDVPIVDAGASKYLTPSVIDQNHERSRVESKVFQDLERLTFNIQHACGSSQCSARLCQTVCSKSSESRPFSFLSARAIALVIQEKRNLSDYLCPNVQAEENELIHDHEVTKIERIDRKSLVQRLANTLAIRNAAQTWRFTQRAAQLAIDTTNINANTGNDLPKCVRMNHYHISEEDREEIDGEVSSFDHVIINIRGEQTSQKYRKCRLQVYEYICSVFSNFERLRQTYEAIHAENWSALITTCIKAIGPRILHELKVCLKSLGTDGPMADLALIVSISIQIDAALGYFGWRDIDTYCFDIGAPDNDQGLTSYGIHLLECITEVVSKRVTSAKSSESFFSKIVELYSRVGDNAGGALACWVDCLYFQVAMRWDGSYYVSTSGILILTLDLLVRLVSFINTSDNINPIYHQNGIGLQMDMYEMTKSWVQHIPNDKQSHILSWPAIFVKELQWEFFRTACYIRMQNAWCHATFAMFVRLKMIPHPDLKTERYLDRRTKLLVANYLVIRVSRENLLMDAYDQLWQREEQELQKPLRVRIGSDEGEIGHDLGGVQVEFFNLLCQELLVPDSPLFVTDPTTHLSWFRPGSLEPLYRYELLGLLFGLAAYNSITLPVSFPLVFYKKLQGYNVDDIEDLKENWSDIHKSLHQLSSYTGNVEEDLAMEYICSLTANGVSLDLDLRSLKYIRASKSTSFQPVIHAEVLRYRIGNTSVDPSLANSLSWPGWTFSTPPSTSDSPSTFSTPTPTPISTSFPSISSIQSVTSSNRQEFISRYTSYHLDLSIRPQFYFFAKGFYRALPPRTLHLLTPSAFQLLLQGESYISVEVLKESTTYDGYDTSSEQIIWFWEIVESFPQEKLQSLLEFVTACKRMPATSPNNSDVLNNGRAGSRMRFKIVATHNDPNELPGSWTCFGNLLLPRYESKEIMIEKLKVALENSIGFGQA